jgi:hypothetical protein
MLNTRLLEKLFKYPLKDCNNIVLAKGFPTLFRQARFRRHFLFVKEGSKMSLSNKSTLSTGTHFTDSVAMYTIFFTLNVYFDIFIFVIEAYFVVKSTKKIPIKTSNCHC